MTWIKKGAKIKFKLSPENDVVFEGTLIGKRAYGDEDGHSAVVHSEETGKISTYKYLIREVE